MFREIRRSERITDQLERKERERKEREMCENGYLKIKAETNMTLAEADAFIMNFWNNQEG